MAAQLQRHPQTGVAEWHSKQVNGTEWEMWLEEFMIHQVDSSGSELPTRSVVANLLQHLCQANRTEVMQQLRQQGILTGLHSLQQRVQAAGGQPQVADSTQQQLQFILTHFSEPPPDSYAAMSMPPARPAPPTSAGPPLPAHIGHPAGQWSTPQRVTRSTPVRGTPSPDDDGHRPSASRPTKRQRGASGAFTSLLGQACECGAGEATLALPGRNNAAVWCPDCPGLPTLAVVANKTVEEDETPLENRVCACGKDVAIYSLRGKGKRGAQWCAACPDLPPAAVNIIEASRSQLYYSSNKLCMCQRTTPTYALPGQMAKWCAQCPKLPAEAVPLTAKMCPCGRGQPRLNVPGTSEPIWCRRCPTRAPDAVDVTARGHCECGRVCRPAFGLPGERARWCSKCPTRPDNAINTAVKRCECGKLNPTMGLSGEEKSASRWCPACPTKPAEAVILQDRFCECGISSDVKYGLPQEGRQGARWCPKCPGRPAEAVDVVSVRCKCGLSVKPRFALPGGGRREALWCSRCPSRPAHTVDILSRRCECGRGRPSFGLPGGKAQWCARCPARAVRSVDVVNKKCECGRTMPSLGLNSENRRRWCPKCPTLPEEAVDMKINMRRCGCEKSSKALFAPPGGSRSDAKWCADCPDKPEDAVNVVPKRRRAAPVAPL